MQVTVNIHKWSKPGKFFRPASIAGLIELMDRTRHIKAE